MSYFVTRTTPMTIEGAWLTVQKDMQFHSDKLGILTVPRRFRFDGATIPRIFWSLVGAPASEGNRRAAALHDMCYRYHLFPRKACDILLEDALKCDGKKWLTRKMMYYAVRLFAKGHY